MQEAYKQRAFRVIFVHAPCFQQIVIVSACECKQRASNGPPEGDKFKVSLCLDEMNMEGNSGSSCCCCPRVSRARH